MTITEDDLMNALAERDIPINKRVLTDWRRRHYLPALQSQGRGKGKGKIYFWTDSNLIERAVLVDDLLCDGFKGTDVNLVLWLFGYQMPEHIIRKSLLTGIGIFEQGLTGGNRSTGEIEDYISQFVYDYQRVVERVNRRYPELEMSPLSDPAGVEKFMNLLANPGLSLDDMQFIEDTDALEEPRHATIQQGENLMQAAVTNDDKSHSWLQWFREYFSLPEIKASLLSASEQELYRAGEDIRRIIVSAGIFFSRRSDVDSLRSEANRIVYRFGSALVLIDLSLRRAGFGPQIDAYLPQICKIFENTEPRSE